MQLELLNEQGQASSKYDAPETVFGREYNEDLVHQIVVAFQANARQGTRAQKDREQVKHSTKKPFRQKGTGRARAGMTSSPLWRGDGRTFPNSPVLSVRFPSFTPKNASVRRRSYATRRFGNRIDGCSSTSSLGK